MEDLSTPREPQVGEAADGYAVHDPHDPAAWPEQIIAEQGFSIFATVEAKVSEIDLGARREAEECHRRIRAACGAATARLKAMSRDLKALSDELDRRDAGRARRSHER
jgi:hypothetical protein